MGQTKTKNTGLDLDLVVCLVQHKSSLETTHYNIIEVHLLFV